MPSTPDHIEKKNEPKSTEDTGNRAVQGEGANKVEFTFQVCDPKPDTCEQHLNPGPSWRTTMVAVKPAFVSHPAQTLALTTKAELGQHIKHINLAAVLSPEAKHPSPLALLPELLFCKYLFFLNVGGSQLASPFNWIHRILFKSSWQLALSTSQNS